MGRCSLVLIVLVMLSGPAGAALRAAPLEVPIVGRPAYYWEAVGHKFRATMSASRTELYLGQNLTLTVRVQALGKYQQPPERPRLQEIPRFKERFKIDGPLPGKPDRIISDKETWEYDYRLRPLRDDVELIPPLPFVWYRPNSNPQLRGFFFTTYARAQVQRTMPDGRVALVDSDELELKVKPLPTPSAKPAAPIQAPEPIFQLSSGPAVVRHDDLLPSPSWSLIGLMLLGPPTLAGVWCVLWRRLYPDAARRARIRHSRAATGALRALAGLAALPEAARVERLAAIVAGYLRDRLDFRAAEPTPAEVEQFLNQYRLPGEAALRTAEFFRACDRIRFGPPAGPSQRAGPAEAGAASPAAPARPGGPAELIAEARQLIGALEGHG